ncbi:alcohol dehydrogenase [Niastella yeongjuensis]|uniref:Alcohol dehydrogenase n=1 Tax=Niastella yeongjuensis TaxID=354355 RepID=A0A1V9FCC2_9BACT|nr:zinc-binding alcohol dehydrogenase family protein [Niastella yeongjuensis]OQP56015.1 alcohol dehydrogenase [Niastella yeongjuensis]SEP25035.1 NADPH:quinone reductase [Niastella yeongjuensis]
MKAVIAYPNGSITENLNYPEPVAGHRDELLVTVKAVAIKHIDRSRATGQHYSSDGTQEDGRIIGSDGVCLLPNGKRVYAIGETGMMAEKAIIDRDRIVHIPDGVDDALAAALPNAVIGAAMGLKFKAEIQRGDIVLINGATGFTGRVAVQIAKCLGAKKVIVTGRNPDSLKDLVLLGADEIISITQDDDSFKKQLSDIHAQTPIDIIVDYLWGHSAELILSCIKGKGIFSNKIRFVSVGSMSGDSLQLSAAVLRSVDLQLTGSGLGAWTKSQVGQFFSDIMPEAFKLAAKGKLKADTVTVPISNLATLWDVEVPNGQRLVVTL